MCCKITFDFRNLLFWTFYNTDYGTETNLFSHVCILYYNTTVQVSIQYGEIFHKHMWVFSWAEGE